MTPTAPALERARQPWGLLALLVIVMCISFFDRGNLAVAAPVLAPELGLSQWSVGVLLSAFFWTYAASQLLSGWLVDRVEVKWVYAIGFLLWSVATLSTAMVSTFVGLLVLRMLLGLGESVTYPASSRVLAAVFKEDSRGLANSLIDLGARIGPAAGTFGGALLVVSLGWRGLFIATGLVGLIWLIPWLIMAPRKLDAVGSHRMATAAAGRPGPGWGELLSRRAVWGTCGGLCGANYAWYFILTWLPSYLVRERGFSMGSLALWGALPFLMMAISSVSCGILADRLIARGGSPVKVRRGFLVSGLLLTAALMPTVLLPDVTWAVAALLATCFVFGIYASNLYALTQALAGPAAAGRWTGIQNGCGNLAGIVSPMVAGFIVQTTGKFSLAFVAAGLACLAGAASFGLLVRESDRLHQAGQAAISAN